MINAPFGGLAIDGLPASSRGGHRATFEGLSRKMQGIALDVLAKLGIDGNARASRTTGGHKKK